MNLLSNFPTLPENNLLKIFREIHNYIYSNDGLSPQESLEEMVKILFMKIFTETHQSPQFSITEEEFKNLSNEELSLSFVNKIKELFTQVKLIYPDLFNTHDQIKLSLDSLSFIVDKLQGISLLDSTQDAKGLAFQKFLSHQEKNGRGQFFTPETVINFSVEIIQPKLNETIIDPACGSGGFLISALNYLKQNYDQVNLKQIIKHNLYGVDINQNIARIAKMKLLLESNTNPHIICTNSVENISSLLEIQPQGFDIVLTNPPFGAGGKIKNSQILQQFDLGYKWLKIGDKFEKTNKLISGQSAEILFIETCLKLLKEGGRMGIVLPNGHFENPSLEYLRFYLKQKAKILGIVNLPQETFIPFGTGIKTSLLFLEKQTLKTINNYQIFFAKIKKLGYQGNKNATVIYQKNSEGIIIKNSQGEAILDEDFSMVIKDYKSFLQTNQINNPNCFNLNFNQLNGRLDYDFYLPENRQLIKNQQNRVKLGDICEIVTMKSSKLKQPNLRVNYIEISDINTPSLEIINTNNYYIHQLPSRASYELEIGDIITAIAGNSVGTKKHATALVTEEFKGAICSNGFRVLRNFQLDIYFLLYFFQSEFFLKQMLMYRTGAAIPNVSNQDLKNILIYLPREDIINQISKKMKKYFNLKQNAKKELASIDFSFCINDN
jgi:type I restriction enzyme M protein